MCNTFKLCCTSATGTNKLSGKSHSNCFSVVQVQQYHLGQVQHQYKIVVQVQHFDLGQVQHFCLGQVQPALYTIHLLYVCRVRG